MEIKGALQSSQPAIEVDKIGVEQTSKDTKIININQNDVAAIKQTGEYTKKQIEKAVEKLNKFLQGNTSHAQFSMHDKFNEIMIKIIDDNTGEIIQEIPSKKIVDMIAKMCEMVGIVFDKRA